jgi:hypothetical protein
VPTLFAGAEPLLSSPTAGRRVSTQARELDRSKALLRIFIGWFAGREDLYVQNAAQVVREPLTEDVILHALDHNYAISAYMGREDGRTHVGALDFDTESGLEDARRVAAHLWVAGAGTVLCHSRRGAHLWMMSEDAVPTFTMRRALEGGMALAGVAHDLQVEVFPKPGGGLAVGALRLPRLPHQTTQQVYPVEVLDDDGWMVVEPDLLALLEVAFPVRASLLQALATHAPRQYPKGLGAFYGYRPPRDSNGVPKATEVLAAWGVEAVAGRTVKCPKHDDKRRSLTVFKDDERVFCGSPSCILHGDGHGVGSIALQAMVGE